MANLMLTTVCNLHCPFCFAADQLSRTPDPGRFLSVAAFESRLDFLDRSGIGQVRLIGGEPTLHPCFPELVERARARGKHLLVFSHGLIPERSLRCLEVLPVESCLVLINTNATDNGALSTPAAHRRHVVMQRLGQRALPGFTIDRVDCDLESLLELIAETGCRRTLRIGLAHPSLYGSNSSLHPQQYPAVGHKLATFAARAAVVSVKLEFDCGYVRCMFSAADLATLESAGAAIGWHCNPILDIGLDDLSVHCFPLGAAAHCSMTANTTAVAMRTQLAQQVAAYRTAGIYAECTSCAYRARGECTGGCLAATMRRYRHSQFQVMMPQEAAQAEA
jgi:hypothetical protein